MSRSKHTRPNKIRAADRVRYPRTPRGSDDASSANKMMRELKELGLFPEEEGAIISVEESADLESPGDQHTHSSKENLLTAESNDSAVVAFSALEEEDRDELTIEDLLPRIIVKKPRKGFIHPASKAEIIEVLEFFGEECFYGLESIKLMQGNDSLRKGNVMMGRLEVPGSIILFDQPKPPWVFNGIVHPTESVRLQQAGAKIEVFGGGLQTKINWSENALRDFVLFDVLMHEIGHHLIQQYKGKRNIRVARTKDHEHYANLFAQRCRQEFLSAGP